MLLTLLGVLLVGSVAAYAAVGGGPPTRPSGEGGSAPAHDKGTFTISANLPRQLYPGRSVPLDLRLSNPNHFDLSVTNLTVGISGVDAAHQQCSVSDANANFSVRQFSGHYPFTLRRLAKNVALSALGFTQPQLPHVLMSDTTSSQNACKAATLTLRYTGVATH